MGQRLYLENGKDLGIARGLDEWTEWMLAVTTESLRVSRGAVVWVAAGCTKDRNYLPACEGLMYQWHKQGGSMYRPCYWHRVGIPGSGGDQWFRADVEYVMCFKRHGPLAWSDNTAMGHAPKFKSGGPMSNRLVTGERVNGIKQWKRGRRPNGNGIYTEESWQHRAEVTVDIANPGNLIHSNAGGGHTGPKVALDGNEAPFPESLAEHFVLSLCPPGGSVLDPFSGSATTAAVASRHDRLGIGLDLRRSQCLLGQRRIKEGGRPVSKLDPRPFAHADGQQRLFPEDAPS